MAARKIADCRSFPSKKNCSLTIAGTEKEVMKVAIWHAVHDHSHKDTPAFRKQIKAMLKNE